MYKNLTLIIDGNNYAYRAYYAYARMKSRKGNPSAVVFGIPTFLSKLINDFKPSRLIVVFDGDRHPKRMELNPGYKGSRGGKVGFDAEDFFKQKDVAMDLLHNGFGIPVYRNRGHEADDMIYKLAKKYKKKGHVMIGSADKDFNQLIDEDLSIWNHNKDRVVGLDNCYHLFGYHPDQCVDFLALDGDKSDGITGYRGIGEVKAKDFISKHSIKEFLKNGLSYPRINNDKLASIYSTNRALIDLKYFNRRFNRKVKPSYAFDSKPKMNKSVIDDISITYSTNSFRVPTFINKFKL